MQKALPRLDRGATTLAQARACRVLVDDLYRQQDFWIRTGVMRERADLTNVVDQSYVEYAASVLGSRP